MRWLEVSHAGDPQAPRLPNEDNILQSSVACCEGADTSTSEADRIREIQALPKALQRRVAHKMPGDKTGVSLLQAPYRRIRETRDAGRFASLHGLVFHSHMNATTTPIVDRLLKSNR